MSLKKKRDGPYIWVTWLKGLMVGEQSCEWSAWFRTNYQDYAQVPSDFDSVSWKVEHSGLLRTIRQERQRLGDSVLVEQQNRFNYRTESGLTIGAQPDLISMSEDETQVTIFDAKTGRRRDSDAVQVRIYMHLLPLAMPIYQGKLIRGVVHYKNEQVEVPGLENASSFVEQFDNLLDILASEEPAYKAPSLSECQYCPIAREECPERMEDSS